MADEQIPDLTDLQAVFDYTTRMIIRQGGPSMNDQGRCLYRAPSGCRCAIGWLIPDDEYDPEMEGKEADDLGLNLAADAPFFKSLQMAHDDSAKDAIFRGKEFWPAWSARLTTLAGRYHLSSAVLSEIPGSAE